MGNKSPVSVGSTPSTLPNDIPGGAGVIIPGQGQVFREWGGKAPFCPSQTVPYCQWKGSVWKGSATDKFDWKGDGAGCWLGVKNCCCYNYLSLDGPTLVEEAQCKALCQIDIDNQSTNVVQMTWDELTSLLVIVAALFSIVCFCIGRKWRSRKRVNNTLKSVGIDEECETDDSEVHELLQ